MLAAKLSVSQSMLVLIRETEGEIINADHALNYGLCKLSPTWMPFSTSMIIYDNFGNWSLQIMQWHSWTQTNHINPSIPCHPKAEINWMSESDNYNQLWRNERNNYRVKCRIRNALVFDQGCKELYTMELETSWNMDNFLIVCSVICLIWMWRLHLCMMIRKWFYCSLKKGWQQKLQSFNEVCLETNL